MGDPDLTPVTFNDVLQQERAAIAAAPGESLFALCLSGGGIRSATFSLGVLQALAKHGWLDQFHYLSSVSGGGYISGWLMAWRKNRGAFGRLSELLCDPIAEPVQHLRQYSNYLTPRMGGLGADTWTLGVILLRNLLLHWMIVVPLLFSVLLIPRLAVAAFLACNNTLFWYVAGAACAVFAIQWFALSLPSFVARRTPAIATDGQMVMLHTLPAFLGCFLFTTGWYASRSEHSAGVPNWVFFVLGAFLHWGGWVAGSLRGRVQLRVKDWILIGAMGGLGGYATVGSTIIAKRFFLRDPLLWVAFGPSLVMGCLILATFLMIGVGSFREELTEDDREWYSRSAAWSLLLCFGWSGLCAFVFFAPSYAPIDRLHGLNWEIVKPNLIGIFATLVAIWLGRLTLGNRRWSIYLGRLLMVLSLTFLFVLLAHLTSSLPGLANPKHATSLVEGDLLVTAGWLVLCVVASFGFSACFSVNRFSMNAFYRNRLIRAYLGATYPTPPTSFTGLASEQNLALHDLLQPEPATTNRPLPVLNMTLNVSKGKNLAWQQRRATSFFASPLFCGWFDRTASASYISPKRYSGDGGLRLGTAMAISGAAVSPNMGYFSSQMLTFLMTLFNLRLGAWLPNPLTATPSDLQLVSPASPLRVLAEAMGNTTESYKWIYLSDGGHFENLGVYEMLRRKVKYLVVVDAAADPSFSFDDVNRLIALARTDFGHDIVPAGENRFHIRYADKSMGYLLLIKPRVTDSLASHSLDVARYAKDNPDFPQETTADQFFDEGQFEAYRRLGSVSLTASRAQTLQQFFEEQFPESKPRSAAVPA